MKNEHLTSKELGKFISGIASPDEMKRMETHISVCSDCSRAVDIISCKDTYRKDTYRKDTYIEEFPSSRVRERVLNSAAALKTGTARVVRFPRFRTAYAAAGFCAAVLLAVFIFTVTTDDQSGSDFLISGEGVYSVSGDNREGLVRAGSVIETGAGKAVLHIPDICSITLFEATSFKIEKFVSRGQSDLFEFKINEGKIISNFFHKKPLSYSFRTPHAVISSTGTELFIRASKTGTVLIVKSGRADLRTSDGSFSHKAGAGLKYHVSNEIISGPASSTDYAMFTNPPVEKNGNSNFSDIKNSQINGIGSGKPVKDQTGSGINERVSDNEKPLRGGEVRDQLRDERRGLRENRSELKSERRALKDKKKREKN